MLVRLGKLFIVLVLLHLCPLVEAKADNEWEPQADPEAVVVSGRARFTVLTSRMIRIQYSAKQMFEDRATFAVVNRKLPVPSFSTREENGFLYIETDYLVLKYKIGTSISSTLKSPNNLSITMPLNGHDVVWYPGKEDALNLKGTKRTLDTASGDNQRPDLEDGIISRAGWAVIDESPKTKRGDGSTTFAFDAQVDGVDWLAQPVDRNAVDWYFMGYGHDYKGALADYVQIAGRQPMPPKYALGYWYSKYQRYSQQDFINIVNEVKQNDIPLDVMVFDMDWHLDGWTGWTWNKNLIPNPEGLINWMHNQGIKVSLNLHPADGVANYEDHFEDIAADMGITGDRVPWTLEDSTFYKSLFKHIIREREQQGVDFWWIDWQQNLTSHYTEGLGETFWCNHVFYNDMRINRPERRPFIFHRWGGLGSHRYPIGFSGDTYSTFGSLAFQPYFTATASNVCFGYWGHDLGGHLQIAPTNPELMLRWMQFGVFSPIFRTHGASQDGNERRIWKFDNFPLLLDCVNLRYELMPYIYTAARQAYETGVSICRPLYYDWPEENEAYRQEGEYMFGDDILVSPIVTAAGPDGLTFHKTWLPEGMWFDVCRNELVKGATTLSGYYGQCDIPYYIKAGAVVVCNPLLKNLKAESEQLVVRVIPGNDGEIVLYEDAGDTQGYMVGQFTNMVFRHTQSASEVSLTIEPRTGQYGGMLAKRSYQVEFLLENRPLSISINGVETTDWTYDELVKKVVVSVPSVSCDELLVVSLKRLESGISQVASASLLSQRYFDLQGREYNYPPQTTYILRRIWSNGAVSTQKIIK